MSVCEQLQEGLNIFQAPAPPSHSTRLTCVSTARWSHAPSKSSNCRSLLPPNMDANIGKMTCLFSHLFVSNYKQVQTSSNQSPAPPFCSTCLTCVSTRWSHAPSESCNPCSPHPPNMDASIGKMPCLFLCLCRSKHNPAQASFKHQLLPLAPLP
jgi:hypothetical protein